MWPEPHRCAVAFSFDLDAEEAWVNDDPTYEHRPVGLSAGRYAATVAMPAILEMLDRYGVRATFFVPGRVTELHPDPVRLAIDAGHELAAHGYRHRPPSDMTEAEEVEDFTKARAALDVFGVPVLGYRAPAWDMSERTLGMLERFGFTYSSNFMDRLHPYVHEGTDIVELPVHWMLSDATHFWFDAGSWTKAIAPASHVREMWDEELAGIREVGGLFSLVCHPQVIGRPSRLRMLDAFVRSVVAMDDVWVATCGEVANLVRGAP